MWRAIGVVALVCVPLWPLAMVVLVELFDFPRSMHVVVGAPLLIMVAAVRKVMGFECPECRRSFSAHARTGMHLTNKRCAYCGLAVGT